MEALLAYNVVDENGNVSGELVVLDANGAELRRIEPDEGFLGGASLGGGYRAYGATRQGQQAILNVDQETVTLVVYPEGEGRGVQIRDWQSQGGGKHWALAWRLGLPPLFLVNLETGVAEALGGFPPDVQLQPETASFNADESCLLVSDKLHSWVLETESPDETRQLGEGFRSSYPAVFSEDGTQILYLRSADDGDTEVVLEDVDGSDSEILIVHDEIRAAWFVPGRQEILLLYSLEATIFSLLDGSEEPVVGFEVPSRPSVFFGPEGTALMDAVSTEGHRWYHVDVAERKHQRLRELDGRGAATPALQESALLIVTSAPQSRAIPAEGRFTAVDLTTGETQDDLELDDLREWEIVSVTDDGECVLLCTKTRRGYGLWLFRAGEGEAQRLATGVDLTGAISPDKRWVVVSETEWTGADFEGPNLRLIPIGGGETIDLGGDRYPFWVHP
jgi:hypothetical protein